MTYNIQTRGDQFQGQLPSEFQILLWDYPRDAWPNHPNFARSIQNWMGAHNGFRALSSYVTEDTQAFLNRDIDDRTFVRRLTKYGDSLLRNLHGHHTWEDRKFFPELSAAEERLEAGLDMLEADHEALDSTLDTFKRHANRAVQLAHLSPKDLTDEAAAVLKSGEAISVLLARHLADEEDLVVPIILHHQLRG